MVDKRACIMVALAAIAVVGISSALKRLRVRTASSKAQDLASLWVGGIETMLDVPGAGTISLAPCETAAESRESFPDGLRAIPAGGAAFAVTAFDPPGVERTRDENARENGKLWAMLKTAGADAAWRAYGVDVTEGWREDGFVLAFADAAAGRRRVAAAARAFDQGAIYEYTLTQGAVARRTLGVGMAVDETTFMRRMPYDELLARRPDLVGLPWAGPSDGRGSALIFVINMYKQERTTTPSPGRPWPAGRALPLLRRRS